MKIEYAGYHNYQTNNVQKHPRQISCDRSALLYTLLSLLTLSVYHYWFFSQMINDINTICREDGDETPHLGIRFLLDLVTFGVYKYVWYAHLADRMCENAAQYGVSLPADGDTLFLWWILLPLGLGRFAAMLLLIRDANLLSAAYNSALRKKKIPAKRPAHQNPQEKAFRREGGLFGLAGSYAGCRIPLIAGQPVVIGRDPAAASVVINDSKLSRMHCTVCYHAAAGNYSIIDHSRNGVFINGQRLPPKTTLYVKAGAVIVLVHQKNSFQLL